MSMPVLKGVNIVDLKVLYNEVHYHNAYFINGETETHGGEMTFPRLLSRLSAKTGTESNAKFFIFY